MESQRPQYINPTKDYERMTFVRAGRKKGGPVINVANLVIAPPKYLLRFRLEFAKEYAKYLENLVLTENEKTFNMNALMVTLSLYKLGLEQANKEKPPPGVIYKGSKLITPKMVDGLNLFFNNNRQTLDDALKLFTGSPVPPPKEEGGDNG